MTLRRAYLAGPDVFWPDAADRAALLKEICARRGFLGLFPLDQAVPPEPGESPASHAARIRAANLDLIRGADLVFANVEPFRGPSADDGTAYEMGYAAALARPVFAYGQDGRSLLQRSRDLLPVRPGLGADWLDAEGRHVEDFGLPVNLMLVTADTGGVHRGLAEAAAAAAEWFARHP